MFQRKRKGILFYWSIRYFTILFLSMFAVAFILIRSIYAYSEHKQRASMKEVSQYIAQTAAAHNGKLPDDLELQGWLDDILEQYKLGGRPMMILLDRQGAVIQQFPQHLPLQSGVLNLKSNDIMSESRRMINLESSSDKGPLWAAVTPVIYPSGTTVTSVIHPSEATGYVLYLAYKENVLEGVLGFQLPRLTAWLFMVFCSWLIIFTMIRQLLRPIQEVSEAAKQVVAGHYHFKLGKIYKEKEIHDLMTSFKEMAEQLRQMEALRAQLLAGVTHELKTPVTSISGLVQAVNDRVVVGKEAEEFLGYCIMECNRLNKMIHDLLDFNSFAANCLQVTVESCHLKDAVQNIVNRWLLSQEYKYFQVKMEVEEEDGRWTTMTEIVRLEQIIINLLNNARDSMEPGGAITIRLASEQDHFLIQVEDTGKGIPEEEHEHIFVPFYRGEVKKTRVRGLGIGLPFSRLIAQSLGGQLVLAKSTTEGTCFSLFLPKKENG